MVLEEGRMKGGEAATPEDGRATEESSGVGTTCHESRGGAGGSPVNGGIAVSTTRCVPTQTSYTGAGR